jgi:hypothetical protein
MNRYVKDGLDQKPRHNPEDEDRDGHRNVDVITVEPFDPADNPK